jgi:hypothetical protein
MLDVEAVLGPLPKKLLPCRTGVAYPEAGGGDDTMDSERERGAD